MDAADIRTMNTASLLRLVLTGRADTRQALAQATGLTRMTITNLTNDLLAKGILEEVAPQIRPKGPGRVAKLLRLARNSPVVAGLWFSKNHVYGVLTDCALNILVGRRVEFGPDDDLDSILHSSLALAQELLAFTQRRVIGVGLALAGVVNPHTGNVDRIVDFHGVESWPVSEFLAERLNVPVVANNMMHASALAEYHYGVGQRLPRFIYVGITDGVGAAIVDSTSVGSDTAVISGEFGHMSIDFQGPPCDCGGRGCLELFASMPRIVESINSATGLDLSSRQEALALCEANEAAADALLGTIRKIAAGINNLVNFRNIFSIVVGDDAFYIPDAFMAKLQEELNQMTLFRGIHEISVEKSQFKDNGPIFGSVTLVLDKVFAGSMTF